MAIFFEQSQNEGEFCNLEGGELKINETSVPKFALVSSKTAADALEIRYTSQEVYDALVDFEDEKSEEAKKLLKPCKDWALAAGLRGDQGAEMSKMAYVHINANLRGTGSAGAGHESQVE